MKGSIKYRQGDEPTSYPRLQYRSVLQCGTTSWTALARCGRELEVIGLRCSVFHGVAFFLILLRRPVPSDGNHHHCHIPYIPPFFS